MGLPVLQLEEQQKKAWPKKLYTLSVRNASIRNVLLSFSRESKENIIVDPDVRGKVTVDLTDVTLPQALDALLTPLNLEYHRESGFIRMSKPKKVTRLFHLDYIITQRSGTRGITANITESTGSGSSLTTGGTTGTTGTTSSTGSTGTGTNGETQGSSVSSGEEQRLFEELALGLGALGLRNAGMLEMEGGRGGGRGGRSGGGAIGTQSQLTSKDTKGEEDFGVFSINQLTGIIVINSYPEILGKAAELIEAVEGTAQRQVLIQAKIVEVLLADEFIYGINWELVFDARGMKDDPKNKWTRFDQTASAFLTKAFTDTTGTFSQFTMATGAMKILLQALEEQGKVNIISSPRVSTLNNQTAIIRVATVETVFLGQTTTIATTATTTQAGASASTVTIGGTLDVTPQISHSGVITMNIHPAITDQVGETVSRFGDVAPNIAVRETDTVVRVRDGETIVIGGLMSDKVVLTENKFPFLWRLPGIGRAFIAEEKTVDKIDLVILITPTILLGDRIEDYSIQEMERVETARRH
ncbi:MAG: secretin and TonB N-terminal domain-containing protein [Planctomycetota bacterium]|jgi:MSHA type pilus biogenesis protein MshL